MYSKNQFDRYPIDQQKYGILGRNGPEVAEIDKKRTFEVSINTETMHPCCFTPI